MTGHEIDRQELVAELQLVRERVILRVESENRRLKRLNLPSLMKATESRRKSGQSFAAALDGLLRDATDRLPEGAIRETIIRIYGLDIDMAEYRPKAWRDHAMKLYGVIDVDTFRKGPERDALSLLAGEIEALTLKESSFETRSSMAVMPNLDRFAGIERRLGFDAAAALIRDNLPGVDSSDCYRLASALDRQQPFMEQACAYLTENSEVSVHSFCRLLAIDLPLILESVADPWDAPLLFLFKQVAERLEAESPRSIEVLELLAFTYHQNIPHEYVMSYLMRQPIIKTEDVWHATLVFHQAVQPLERIKLIQVESITVNINPLAQAVWRSIFSPRFRQIMQRMVPILIDSHEYGELYREHGWGLFSATGRNVCNRVLLIRIHDHVENAGRLHNEGRLAGAEWNALIANLWRRMLLWSEMVWEHFGLYPGNASQPSPHTAKHKIQLIEMEDMADYAQRRASEDVSDLRLALSQQGAEEDPLARLADVVGEIAALVWKPVINTKLGELDYRAIDPHWRHLDAREVCESLLQDFRQIER